jgi:hypothetical protein
MIAWWIIYGQPFAVPHGTAYITPYENHLWSVLVSPLYGMLWWTPAFFFGLVGYGWFFARTPRSALFLFAGLALYIFYNATLARWFGGGSFGMRRFTVLAPLFALGLTALMAQLRHRHPLLPAALGGALSAWSILLTARYILSERIRNPDFLEQLDVRAFLFNPELYFPHVLPTVLRKSWFLATALAPTAESLLVAGTGLVTVIVCVLIVWRFFIHSKKLRECI